VWQTHGIVEIDAKPTGALMGPCARTTAPRHVFAGVPVCASYGKSYGSCLRLNNLLSHPAHAVLSGRAADRDLAGGQLPVAAIDNQ